MESPITVLKKPTTSEIFILEKFFQKDTPIYETLLRENLLFNNAWIVSAERSPDRKWFSPLTTSPREPLLKHFTSLLKRTGEAPYQRDIRTQQYKRDLHTLRTKPNHHSITRISEKLTLSLTKISKQEAHMILFSS